LIQEAFDQAGKTNLHYARYDNLGHALTGREDVYAPMLDWIEDKEKDRLLLGGIIRELLLSSKKFS